MKFYLDITTILDVFSSGSYLHACYMILPVLGSVNFNWKEVILKRLYLWDEVGSVTLIRIWQGEDWLQGTVIL